MKICPFISHMIGEGQINILEMEGADAPELSAKAKEQVVILGYDGDDGDEASAKAGKKAKARTKSKTKAKSKTGAGGDQSETSPLFCMKDSCRFFLTDSKSCTFDDMYGMAADRAKEFQVTKDAQDELGKNVMGELGKFWKFQTKSVSELISSIGDTEKNQQKAIETLSKSIDKRIGDLSSDMGKSDDSEMKAEIEKLRRALEEREDGMENLSSTMSEMVISIEDALKEIQGQQTDLSSRLGSLESSLPGLKTLQKDLMSAMSDKLESSLPDSSYIQDGVEKVLDRKLGEFAKNKNTDPRLDTLAENFESVIEDHRKLENRLEQWQSTMENRVVELKEQHSSWGRKFDEVASQQSSIVDMLSKKKSEGKTEGPSDNRIRAKKLNNLGVASFHNGALEDARDQFLEALRMDNTFAECYNNLGLVYSELSDEEKASEAFSSAIKLNPELHAAYNNLGYLFYRQGSYDQAIEMYNESLGRSTNNSSAYTNLGNAYFKQGNQDEARTAWEKAIELDPANEKARRGLEQLDPVRR